MNAPFPYTGGKSRWARAILERLEPCTVYVEPFAGSLAVLLASAPHRREVVCDKNGHIPNFWRAIRAAPDEVAYWADYPSYHHDLTARHIWLTEWGKRSSHLLSSDPDWFDAKAAGWWVWGQSNWIRAGWCTSSDMGEDPSMPNLRSGDECSVNRLRLPDAIPDMHDEPGGRGVKVQRTTKELQGEIGSGARLKDWFHALAQRLARVVILNRDWQSALTPTVLMNTDTSSRHSVGALLDPPYRTDTGRAGHTYIDETNSNDTARESYEWAVAHGDRYKIAYCCHPERLPTTPRMD